MTTGFPRVGDEFAGYDIEDKLGQGGMGVVFAARQRTLRRTVALKVLSPVYAEDAGFRERFAREAELLASVDSPHVITIFDHGDHDGCLYIVTQLVAGGDLASRLEAGPLPVRDALLVARQLAAALAEAHAVGIVHRDVKPSNVLLRPHGAPHAYLCDFGVARGRADGLTKTGSMVGSAAYMSPEQCRGEPATPQSDIYSLGCLLYALLTGKPPFVGAEIDVLNGHLFAAPPELDGAGDVWSDVGQIIRRALAKDPRDRYGSAARMEADLERARTGFVGEATDTAPTSVGRATALTDIRPAGATAPKPPSPDTRPLGTEPTPRRRTRWPLAAAGVLVLAAGVCAATIAASRGGNDARAGSPAEERSGPTTASATATPATSSSGSSGSKTCWDQASVPSTDQCPTPVGLAGIRYMFPSFVQADRNGSCVSKPGDLGSPGKTDSWSCAVRGPDGATVQVVYGAWRTWESARDHYTSKYGSSGKEVGDFLTFATSAVGNSPGDLQSARFLRRDYGFSVTIIGRTEADIAAGVATVRARPLRDVPR